ncbi:unnamed protein product, partial [Rotaria sordida]
MINGFYPVEVKLSDNQLVNQILLVNDNNPIFSPPMKSSELQSIKIQQDINTQQINDDLPAPQKLLTATTISGRTQPDRFTAKSPVRNESTSRFSRSEQQQQQQQDETRSFGQQSQTFTSRTTNGFQQLMNDQSRSTSRNGFVERNFDNKNENDRTGGFNERGFRNKGFHNQDEDNNENTNTQRFGKRGGFSGERGSRGGGFQTYHDKENSGDNGRRGGRGGQRGGDVNAVQTRQQAKAKQDPSISSSPCNSSNPVVQFELLTVNDQLNLSQGHATSPIHDIHSPVNNQSIVPQGLTTAPMYDMHSAVDQSIVPQGPTTAPMYNMHSPVNQSIVCQHRTTAPIYDKHSSIDIFGLNSSPNYNLPETCTTNPRNMRLSFSDNSLSSDAEDEPQWLIKLEKKYNKKILDWDGQMMKDWEEVFKKFQEDWKEVFKKFQEDWNKKVQMERSRLIEQLQAELNEEKRKRLVKEQ